MVVFNSVARLHKYLGAFRIIFWLPMKNLKNDLCAQVSK
jgi:hypothetical protein